MEHLAALIVLSRPDQPTNVDVAQGFDLARLDSLEIPASMVLERARVRTAADLLDLLRLVSVDSALAVLGWARDEDDQTNILDAIRVVH